MREYVSRMEKELKELKGRIKKAEKAVETPPYGITTEGLNLLETQIGYMKQYAEILERRLKFEDIDYND